MLARMSHKAWSRAFHHRYYTNQRCCDRCGSAYHNVSQAADAAASNAANAAVANAPLTAQPVQDAPETENLTEVTTTATRLQRMIDGARRHMRDVYTSLDSASMGYCRSR